MTITYEYEGALYVNLTNRCNCNCVFCLRHGKAEGSIYPEDFMANFKAHILTASAGSGKTYSLAREYIYNTLRPQQDEELRRLALEHPKVRDIGEIGLDYYWKENPPKEFQAQVFHRQMELAEELKLPVIIHDREAHQDCLNIVKSHPNVTGVYHCYSGSIEDAKTLVKMGWMISFTGVITFKNARRSLEIIEWLPMEHIMVETDAPYLTPEPFRGKRNDSAKVRYMIEAIANVKGMDPEEVARITLENGKRFFNIK